MKLSYAFLVIWLAFIISNASCMQKQIKKNDAESWDVKNTRMVESYDKVNAVAIKNAQDSLDLFIKLFSANKNDSVEYFIKSEFRDGENIENMWSIVHSITHDSLSATLNNVPLNLTNIKLDDNIKVAKKNVQDWMIYKGDSLLMGNFMVRDSK